MAIGTPDHFPVYFAKFGLEVWKRILTLSRGPTNVFAYFTIVSDVRGSIGRVGTDSATGNSSGKTTLDDVFWTPFVHLLVFPSFFRHKGFLVGRTYWWLAQGAS